MVSKNKAQLLAKRKVGRPRIYDPKEIVKELKNWVKDEESISLTEFCADRGYSPTLIWRLEKEDEDFSEAYILVKMKIAGRRERHVNNDILNYGTFNRYQNFYDPFLKKAEDDEKDQDAARKKGIVETEQANLFMLAKMASQGKISQKD